MLSAKAISANWASVRLDSFQHSPWSYLLSKSQKMAVTFTSKYFWLLWKDFIKNCANFLNQLYYTLLGLTIFDRVTFIFYCYHWCLHLPVEWRLCHVEKYLKFCSLMNCTKLAQIGRRLEVWLRVILVGLAAGISNCTGADASFRVLKCSVVTGMHKLCGSLMHYTYFTSHVCQRATLQPSQWCVPWM